MGQSHTSKQAQHDQNDYNEQIRRIWPKTGVFWGLVILGCAFFQPRGGLVQCFFALISAHLFGPKGRPKMCRPVHFLGVYTFLQERILKNFRLLRVTFSSLQGYFPCKRAHTLDNCSLFSNKTHKGINEAMSCTLF